MHLFEKIQLELIRRINLAENNIKIAVTWFTNWNLSQMLAEKLKSPGFILDLIVLNDRINNKKEGVDFQELIDLGANFYFSDTQQMVHHKFCIIDDRTLITGSYNWTYYAEHRNWENIVILTDPVIVGGYSSEFEKIISQHKKIEKVKDHISTQALGPESYLESDYLIQAKDEERKGNDLSAARIYTEVIRKNKLAQEAVTARTVIIEKINKEGFNFSPFEIGIKYKNGYQMAIPAYSKLPQKVTKGGRPTKDGVKSIRITIQKNDIYPKTILQFSINNLKPVPLGTKKLDIELDLQTNGILTVTCREIDGNRMQVVKDNSPWRF